MLWNTKSNQCVECLWPSGAYTQRCIDVGNGSWVRLQSVNALTSVTVHGTVVPYVGNLGAAPPACARAAVLWSQAPSVVVWVGSLRKLQLWVEHQAAQFWAGTIVLWARAPLCWACKLCGHLGALWCWQNWVFLFNLPWEWQWFPAYVMWLRYFSHSVFSESLFPTITALEETLETRNFGALDGYYREIMRWCHKEKRQWGNKLSYES